LTAGPAASRRREADLVFGDRQFGRYLNHDAKISKGEPLRG
jgi:hypothetical protein